MGNQSAGFTLIEMMVTIALIAIFAALAVPAYNNFIAGNRAATEMNTFVSDLQYARVVAMENGTSATMCVSTDGETCKDSGDWNEGWIVFLDRNGDGTVDAGENLLRVQAALPGGDSLTGNSNVEDTITFNRFGVPAGLGTGTVTLKANPDRVAYRRCVSISSVGKMQAHSGSDCS